jgi:hypothetical protein
MSAIVKVFGCQRLAAEKLRGTEPWDDAMLVHAARSAGDLSGERAAWMPSAERVESMKHVSGMLRRLLRE